MHASRRACFLPRSSFFQQSPGCVGPTHAAAVVGHGLTAYVRGRPAATCIAAGTCKMRSALGGQLISVDTGCRTVRGEPGPAAMQRSAAHRSMTKLTAAGVATPSVTADGACLVCGPGQPIGFATDPATSARHCCSVALDSRHTAANPRWVPSPRPCFGGCLRANITHTRGGCAHSQTPAPAPELDRMCASGLRIRCSAPLPQRRRAATRRAEALMWSSLTAYRHQPLPATEHSRQVWWPRAHQRPLDRRPAGRLTQQVGAKKLCSASCA